jgi:hypothetical protein
MTLILDLVKPEDGSYFGRKAVWNDVNDWMLSHTDRYCPHSSFRGYIPV